MDEEEIKAINDFLLDIHCLDDLNKWISIFNIFDVLNIARNEIRHSNMIAWLLNSKESHEMRYYFLESFIHKLIDRDELNETNITELLLLDYDSFSVYRELKNIDILLLSEKEKYVIAIENKIDSTEHDNQLNRYRKVIEEEYPLYKKIYLYLTPYGDEASDKVWKMVDYSVILEILEEYKKNHSLDFSVSVLVNNYIELLRREIVEDKELIEICNTIYNKHKKALDLIYKYKADDKVNISRIVKETMQDFVESGKILFQDNQTAYSFIVFKTLAMNELIPELENQNGSWNSKESYRYWINVDYERKRVKGFLELGGQNQTEQNLSKFEIIYKYKKVSSDIRKFKRVFSTNWYSFDVEEDMDTRINQAVTKVINKLLSEEKNILHLFENQ